MIPRIESPSKTSAKPNVLVVDQQLYRSKSQQNILQLNLPSTDGFWDVLKVDKKQLELKTSGKKMID